MAELAAVKRVCAQEVVVERASAAKLNIKVEDVDIVEVVTGFAVKVNAVLLPM